VTHRRRSGVAGICDAVASVTLVAAVLTRDGETSQPRPPTEPSPTRSAENSLTNAPMAVRGEDYRVLTTYDVRSLAAGATGRLPESMTPDGMVVYRDGPDGSAAASEIGLLDPETGQATPLPAAIAQIGANRIISDDTMIAGASYGVPAAAVWYFDTATRLWGTFGMDDLVAGGLTGIDPATATVSRIQFATNSPDELYLSVHPAKAPNARSRVVSVTLGGSQSAGLDPVDHGAVSLWAIAADTMASIPNLRTAQDSITLRDLNSDSDRTVEIPNSDNCSVRQIWMRVDRLIAKQECTLGDAVQSRLEVFGLVGKSIDVVQAPSFEVISTANNLMMLEATTPPGLFLYDMTSGDLVRLTRHNSAFEDVAAGEQAFWTFSEPIQRGAGLRISVADFSE
jgi:hypothetical protein